MSVEFIVAARDGKRSAILRFLDAVIDVDCRGVQGTTALVAASGDSTLEIVQMLVDRGAALDLPGRFAMTPLMNACDRDGAAGSAIGICLVEKGANVLAVSVADDMDAISFAANQGTRELIKCLVNAGASVDGPLDAEITPLMLAARAENIQAIEELKANGADLSRRCHLEWAKGGTALDIAKIENCQRSIAVLEKY